MKAQSSKLIGTAVALLASLAAGCGDVARNGRSPVLAVITSLEAASGAEPDTFGGVLHSDVQTLVSRTIDGETVRIPTVFSDPAEVEMRLQLRDLGVPGLPAAPSSLNDVTFTRYRVTYRRSDGRNTPGVDVPHPFDSAATFTVPSGGSAAASFILVRHIAKEEPPLRALITNSVIITTIAEVTFYGHDLAGNEVMVTGSIGIFFGNFGDPE